MKPNPVCTVLWRDAAFTYEKELPDSLQNPQLTVGFVIEATDDYTFIATNVSYDEKTGALTPLDGLIIPKSAIMEFKKIGNYHD